MENKTKLSAGQIVFNETFHVEKVPYHRLVSYETRQIFTEVNYVYLGGPVSVSGIVGNIFNIIVFCKQGFKDSMNISLLGLAIADLLSLIPVFWIFIACNPLFTSADLPFNILDITYFAAGIPHLCFTKVTSFITAFITLERCLCISMPLKVKTIITSSRTRMIIVSMFVIIIALFAPLYFVDKLSWNFNSELNRTILSLVGEDYKVEVVTVLYLIYGVFLPTILLLVVIVCTIILIVKLNKKSRWRQTATGGTTGTSSQSESISVKEKKVVKMVTLISVIFIICYLPAFVLNFTMTYEPEFSFHGKYENIFFVIWSFVFLLETINSSVNILVYYNMSSKYKITFTETFHKRSKDNCTSQ